MSAPGYAPEAQQIRDRFTAEWTDGGSPRTPVDYENEHFDAQVDAADPTTGRPLPWVRLTVFGSDASRASLGGSVARYRHDGETVIEVFAPRGGGDAEARQLADHAAGIFRSWQSGELTFWTPRVVRLGREGQWYRLNVIAPFKRDSVFSHQ